MSYKKKLIEVALPLEAINSSAIAERYSRVGHPFQLHLWWARRPLTTTRAVIFSSLVDDPSSHPEFFPTEKEQIIERQRLFKLMEDLCKWENSNNQEILDAAKTEIMKSTDGNPPALLDPFAGGGAIPLEAQRLGLEAHASDLNPVAVMINKAMIEIPPKFAGMPPVNPEAREKYGKDADWSGAKGLAEDVRYYGEWMKQEAFKRIGHLYPKIKVPEEQGGGEATVIAWIWARTVKCPNPACGCEMPLVKSFELSKKKGKEAYIHPVIKNGQISYEVKYGIGAPDGTVIRSGAKCLCCGTPVDFPYIRDEGKQGRLNAKLMAIVAEGENGRIYISPNNEHCIAADVPKPENYPSGVLSGKSRVNVSLYGIDETSDLFTNRQLMSLATFCSLIPEIEIKIKNDSIKAGISTDLSFLSDNGTGATAYGQAVSVYLSFVIDKMADYNSSVCRWQNTGGKAANTFSRQAIPMVWDFAEANPFANAYGGWSNKLKWTYEGIKNLPSNSIQANVKQLDAQSDNGFRNIMISTDPPYYDNIEYADLSDFFYVWLRQSLKGIYPELFSTLLVPKAEELVATPHRFGGSKEKAKDFFEKGMFETFKHVYLYAREDIPVTIYYAFKQQDSDNGPDGAIKISSSGWETMLSAIIQSGFSITGTWPIRTEMANRSIASGSNALASSIVLVCRKRPDNAPICTRRDFINALKRELKSALKELQRSNIAPVDLAQSAIGPGMGIYSRYSKVLEADGSPMSVRSALQIINQELDLYFSEQDGELDRDSRFCIDLYSQYAFNDMKFGEADVLARAKNTSVEKLAERGVLYAQKGVVHLLEREELPETVKHNEDFIWLLTQQLTRAMETGGVNACAKIVFSMLGSNAEHAKALAYRLFTISEQKGWAQEAYAYNSLVIAWPDIQMKAAELRNVKTEQVTLSNYED